jgi:hypothetical protein
MALTSDRFRSSGRDAQSIASATRRSRRSVRRAPCRTIGIARALRMGAGARAAAFVRDGRGWALLKPSAMDSVLSPRGDEAPCDSGAVVTDLSMQSVRQGVDVDDILCRDSVLCDQGQDGAN